jgi:hypothetical protein
MLGSFNPERRDAQNKYLIIHKLINKKNNEEEFS